VLGLALVCLVAPARAADAPFVSGTQPREGFGTGLAVLGNLDGDGTEDFAVGSPLGYNLAGLLESGFVQIFSGATGQLLGRIEGEAAGDNFGTSVAGIGDVDGDGRPDLAVGAPHADAPPLPTDPFGTPNRRPIPRAGRLTVYSGATLAELWRFNGAIRNAWVGELVVDGGDLDGDGRRDVIVSAPYAAGPRNGEDPGPGEVHVLSGATGAEIFRFTGDANTDEFGHALAGGIDINGDGRPEIVVGAWTADPAGRTNAGSVYIFSGADGSLIDRLNGRSREDHFGGDVLIVPDMTNDGVPDLLVGAPDVVTNVADGGGAISLFSGADWSEVYRRADPWVRENYHLGVEFLALPDLDGDLVPDFFATAARANKGAGSVFLFSGRTGTVFGRLNGAAEHDNLGRRAATFRRATGAPSYLLAAPGPDSRSRQIGRVYQCSSFDSDGDGAWDCLDNCPALSNPSQEDTDADGLGDDCDPCTDRDGDGFGERLTGAETCALDLCPALFNLDQTDTDRDSFADACDNCTILPNPAQRDDERCQPVGGRIRIGKKRRAAVNRFNVKLNGKGFDPTVLNAAATATPLRFVIEDVANGARLFEREMRSGMVRRVGTRRAQYQVSKELSTGIDRLELTLSKRGALDVQILGHGVARANGRVAARLVFGEHSLATVENGTAKSRRRRKK
jgi:hypothetical protein